jgi:polyhydroxyalkanoate synthesis regulator phasin
MSISAKRKLAVGAAGLAVLAGSGGAYAAAAGTPQVAPKPADHAAETKAFLDDVAKRLNVTRDQLDAAVKGAAEARIDAAVAAGKLTKEQGEAAKKRLANGLPALGGPGILGGKPGRGPGGPGFGHRGFGFGFGFEGAADYLGLTEAQLREQLENGKSLADVAKAQNKDVAGLKAALKAKVTTKLDEAVKDGHLTAAQKTKLLADIDARLDDIINGTPPKRPDGPKFRWR